jgi:Tat protein secretion system quality control protein TatD with DNase activity
MISSREEQIKAMELFLEKASQNNHLPLFLHEREAFNDFYSGLVIIEEMMIY